MRRLITLATTISLIAGCKMHVDVPPYTITSTYRVCGVWGHDMECVLVTDIDGKKIVMMDRKGVKVEVGDRVIFDGGETGFKQQSGKVVELIKSPDWYNEGVLRPCAIIWADGDTVSTPWQRWATDIEKVP